MVFRLIVFLKVIHKYYIVKIKNRVHSPVFINPTLL